ncbi:MAG: hypothetical protein ACUVWQ_09420, partial [Candidatus Aminicenantales bacterium]
IGGILALLMIAFPVLAQQQSKDVTFQVELREWIDLYIGTNIVSFTDRAPNPGQNPPTASIPANENPVSVRAFAILKPSSTLYLTVTALDDFHTTIPASTVSWTAIGAGYQDGTLMKQNPVAVGKWKGGIHHWHDGKLNFYFFRDYVNQEPGIYSIVATFILSKV